MRKSSPGRERGTTAPSFFAAIQSLATADVTFIHNCLCSDTLDPAVLQYIMGQGHSVNTIDCGTEDKAKADILPQTLLI